MNTLIISEVVRAYGHENIKAIHKTTIEITKENNLTPRGDCIIGVSADKAVSDLDSVFKQYLKREDTVVIIVLEVGCLKDIVLAQGSSSLVLRDSNRLIIRKSTFVNDATMCIRANKAACDIDRKLIERLKSREVELLIKIYLININELEKQIE